MGNNIFASANYSSLSAGQSVLRVLNSSDEEAVVEIFEEIGESWWGDSVSARQFIRNIEGITAKTIRLRINSPGGSVFDGNAIYNALRAHPARVVGSVEGIAASIASVILMAADSIEIPENAMIMIHNPWSCVCGGADDFRKNADVLDKVKETLISSYRRSGQSDEKISELMSAETWMTAEEAVDLGFADKIIDKMDKVQASFSAMQMFNNVPKKIYSRSKSMNKKLRAWLESKGLDASASEAEAVAYQSALEKKGVVYAHSGGQPPQDGAGSGVQPPQDGAGSGGQPPQDGAGSGGQPPQGDQNITAMQAELARQAEVKKVCAQFNIPASIQANFISDPQYTGAMLVAAAMQTSPHSAPLGGSGGNPYAQWQHGEQTDGEKFRAAVRDALIIRNGGKCLQKNDGQLITVNPAAGYEDFRHRNSLQVAEAVLQHEGVNTRAMSPVQIAAAAMSTTSDYPIMLQEAANVFILRGYESAPVRWPVICSREDAPDYREVHALNLSGTDDLEELKEDGVLPVGNFVESEETMSVSDKGLMITASRKLIINDKIGLIMRRVEALGKKIRPMEDKAVFSLLISNPAMKKDNKALFHVDHGNLATGAAFGQTSLSAARLLMNTQQDAKGNIVELDGKTVLHGAADRTAVEIELNKITLPVADQPAGIPNPFAYLQPLWSGRITSGWYLFADPSMYPVLSFSYLSGQEQPYIESEMEFGTRGVKWAIVHTYGVGIVDNIGAVWTPAE